MQTYGAFHGGRVGTQHSHTQTDCTQSMGVGFLSFSGWSQTNMSKDQCAPMHRNGYCIAHLWADLFFGNSSESHTFSVP